MELEDLMVNFFSFSLRREIFFSFSFNKENIFSFYSMFHNLLRSIVFMSIILINF